MKDHLDIRRELVVVLNATHSLNAILSHFFGCFSEL